MYQKVTIVGNLGQDPELRYLPDGTPVTNFSVATNRRWGGENPGEETTWFRVTTWRRQAETCNQYLTKGQMVIVEGRLTPDRNTGRPKIWTTQDGNAGANYELSAARVVFLGSRNESAGDFGDNSMGADVPSSPASGMPANPASDVSSGSFAPSQPASDANPITEDEIPF